MSALDPDRHLSVFNLKSTPFPDILAVFIPHRSSEHSLKLLPWPRADPLLTLWRVRGTAPGYHPVISSSADKMIKAKHGTQPVAVNTLWPFPSLDVSAGWAMGKAGVSLHAALDAVMVNSVCRVNGATHLQIVYLGASSYRGCFRNQWASVFTSFNMSPRCIKHAVRT